MDLKEQIIKKEEELKQLQDKKFIEKVIDTIKPSFESLTNYMDQFNSQFITSIQQKLSSTEEKIVTLENKVQQTDTSSETIENKIDSLSETIKKKDFKGPKGEKGDEGLPGPKGIKGDTGKDGKVGPKGDKGDSGKNGKDGHDGIDGKDGKDGSPDTSDQIRDKLESLKGEKRLDAKAIKGLERFLNFVSSGVSNFLGLTDVPHSYSGQAGKVLAVKENENGLEFVTNTGGGGVTDHGALTGLLDDDHPQYLTETRADTRYALITTLADYYLKTEVDTLLNNKVDKNSSITGATKTKITYDSKGLVTAGSDATTADINDSSDRRYVTDTNLVVINNTSGTNTGDETTATIKTKLGVASTSTDGYLTSTDWNTFNNKQAALGYTPENAANKGVANGYASLDSGGKVPVAQLPSSLMEYQGVWNASTNTPTLVDGSGNTGDVYRVSVAGTRNLGSGSISFNVGDYAIYNPSGIWEKSDTTDAISDINGLTGSVSITGTTNQINVSNVGGITLSTPQDIHTGAKPTFAGEILTSSVSGKTLDITANFSGEVSDLYGVYSNMTFEDGAQSYSVYGIYSEVNSISSNTAVGLYVKNNATGAGNGTIGAHIEGGDTTLEVVNSTGGGGISVNVNTGAPSLTITNFGSGGYGIYNVADLNYISGKLGLRSPTTIPSAYLHIGAGAASAGNAPLKISAGTNLSTPEAGAVEFDGTDIFYTTSTPTRRTVLNTNGVQTFINKKTDTTFQIIDATDATKKIAFDAASATTGTTTTLKTVATGNITLTLPNTSVTLLGNSEASLVQNKIFDSTCTVSLLDNKFILADNGDNSKVMVFELSGISGSTTRTLTVPNASGTIVLLDATQTLTNKTLTAPVISAISNTGILTLPTSTDTLVGKATTDILTNKSISGSTNTLTNIGNSSLTNSSVIIGSTSVSLGNTAATIAGLTLTTPILSSSTGTTAAQLGYDSTNKSLTVGNGTTAQAIDIDSWRTYTSTVGGFSGTPTQTMRYCKSGKTVHLIYNISGTSNATSLTFTLPLNTSASAPTVSYFGRQQDNGVFSNAQGMLITGSNNATVTVYKDPAGTAWTASGTKTIYGELTYESV